MSNRKKTVIATVAVAAVIAIVTIVLVTQDSTATRAPQAQSPGTTCPTSPQDSTIPTAPPADLRWKGIGAIEVPTSASDGPFRVQGDVQSCFAHSPMGAVLAAYDIFATLLSPEGMTSAALAGIAPGPGRQAYIAGTRAQGIPTLTPGELVQPVGFQVVAYTPEQATIETLASAGASPTRPTSGPWSGLPATGGCC
jgi:hypothetical protein